MQLVKRYVQLSVDTLKVAPELRIQFKISKSYKPTLNTAEVTIFNLTPGQRAQLSKVKEPLVKLAAGYGTGDDGLTQLFYGHAIHVEHKVQGPDILTTVSTTDGGTKKQTARVNLSFGPGTKTGTVLTQIAKALGLNPGNVAKVARDINLTAKADIYTEGTVVSGAAANELGHLCRSCGYDWSIQDETLQLRKIGQAGEKFAIELNPTSGLIESPSISSKGVCSGTCLLFKAGAGLDMVPGRLIHISSAFVTGQFILAKIDCSGDNYADDWYCNFEAVTKAGDFAKVG